MTRARQRLLREPAAAGVERSDGHDAVADCVIDTFTDRGDHAGDLLARRERQRGSEWVDSLGT